MLALLLSSIYLYALGLGSLAGWVLSCPPSKIEHPYLVFLYSFAVSPPPLPYYPRSMLLLWSPSTVFQHNNYLKGTVARV
jgi:hypothetical protein